MINSEYLRYFALGDVCEINSTINLPEVIKYCEQAEFKDRGKGIYSLSLTSLDGTLGTAVDGGLKYIDNIKDGDVCMPTEHYAGLVQHISLLHDFAQDIARTRIFKGMPCGVWEPHRDSSSVIRIILPIANCNRRNFRMMLENTVLPLNDGQAYLVNTIKEHAGVVFWEPCYIMVMSIKMSSNTEKILTKLLNIK